MRRRKRLLWQIYPPMVLITILALAAIDWYAISSLQKFFLRQTVADLKIRAELIRERLQSSFINHDYEVINEFCRAEGRTASSRITVILPNGRVVGDSEEDPARMDNHADRVEVIDAVHEGFGSSMRFSGTLQQNMMYVAVPLVTEGDDGARSHNLKGILRLSIPLTSLDKALGRVYARIVLGTLLLIVVAALVTYGITRKITLPLEEMRNSAEMFAQGDFERKITVSRDQGVSIELAGLADSLNKMAVLLDERIWSVTEQRNQLNAVFSGMKEAVIVVDMDEKIINVNQAAVRLLGMPLTFIAGKPVLEVVRNHDLQRFVTATLAGGESLEDEIVLREEAGDTYLLAHGALLRDTEGGKFGALVVLNDVTRIRRLENVRRDFVANVSHELKTPITTIKGFVETLLDGALNDREDALRFLGIVMKNADRLNAIVEDLLTLSKIEQQDENAFISFSKVPLCVPLRAAVEACELKAGENDIKMRLSCPLDLIAEINAPLMEQAVTNLIVNGIKYSHAHGEVLVEAGVDQEDIFIRVKDYGVGIGEEHLPRMFERFYRSDKARSRKLGGTGLGLAIVKHIVQAHGGAVGVQSTLGKGTVFTIRLPVTAESI